jgi:hypothetical protein
MRSKLTVFCLIAFALLAACSTDSKTTQDTPSPFNSPTPSPPKPATSAPSPVAALAPPAKPTPTPVRDPASGLSEEMIRQDMLAVDKSITYEKLKKNADEYDSYPWAFMGKVFQIQESGGRTGALISLDAWGNKTMWVTANFTTEFVEKDQVYVVGYLAGNYSYTSVAGWNLTVPAIEARAILKPSEAARIRAGKPLRK